MAIIQNGPFGIISGKLGNIVYVNRNGINYVRSKPASIKKSNSASQKSIRIKFTLVINFLKPFKPLIAKGYNQRLKGRIPFNLAMSYHLKYAIGGSYPDFNIRYQDTFLTMGSLPLPKEPFVVKLNHEIIAFHWKCRDYNPDDRAVLIVYSESLKKVFYEVTPAIRTHQIAYMTIPEDLREQLLHCWITFKSPTEEKYSNSVYLGTILL